jgi:hypothetical protein
MFWTVLVNGFRYDIFEHCCGQDMTVLHAIGDSLENKEKDNDEPDEMGPYVAGFVMNHKESFCYFLGRSVVEPIPINYVLIVPDEGRSLLELAQIWLGRNSVLGRCALFSCLYVGGSR